MLQLRPWRKPPTKTDTLTLRPPQRYKQTAQRSPPTDRRRTMYRPHYYDRPIRHLFRGRFTADKNTAETGMSKGKRSPLHTPRGTTTPWSRNSIFFLH
ncbi:hypothetical protein NDU88_005116 [Pleurodeles waltl]|uniref:Uncharacterized protein n=1 Tax=Pleurodeles waltl TaxID=8319 RepID=A0AAV7VI37_PLEWA|nr:hypothetical protein NDU88_005116 [Pleurodeles waltl]